MPVESEEYREGEFRWSPYEEEEGYAQMGIVADGDPSNNQYVLLGPVMFSGAVQTAASIGIAVAAVLGLTTF